MGEGNPGGFRRIWPQRWTRLPRRSNGGEANGEVPEKVNKCEGIAVLDRGLSFKPRLMRDARQ